MKKEITLGQLLGASVAVLIAVITGWITISNKVTRQETEIQQLKADQYTMQLKIDKSLDRIEADVRNILIGMQNKVDRK